MNSKIKCSIFLILITLILISPVPHLVKSDSGYAKGKGQDPPFLEGDPINILGGFLGGYDEITLPADMEYYVLHGYGSAWNDVEPSRRRVYLQEGVRFELDINGEKVVLRKWIHHYRLNAQMRKLYYIQFEPDQFSAGDTVDFTGRWYWDDILDIEYTLTVTFS